MTAFGLHNTYYGACVNTTHLLDAGTLRPRCCVQVNDAIRDLAAATGDLARVKINHARIQNTRTLSLPAHAFQSHTRRAHAHAHEKGQAPPDPLAHVYIF